MDTQTNSDMATVGENMSDDGDDDICEAERLKKRHQLSGARAASKVNWTSDF